MDRKLEEIILSVFRTAPSEPCVWWHGVWWSRGALRELAEDCQANLLSGGFVSGNRLALLLPNCPLFWALCVAVWSIGGTVVPLNPRLEFSTLLRNLILADVFGAVIYKEQENKVALLEDRGIPCVVAPLAGVQPSFKGRVLPDEKITDIAAIFLTSGTTGDAKAVPITHSNFIHNMDACLKVVTQIDEEDVFLNALPNFHSLGFAVCGLLPLVYGLPQAIVLSFMPPESTLEAIRSAKVTVVPAVPMMVSLLLGCIARGINPPPSLSLIICGGDRLSAKFAERAERLLGVTILEGYGLTETSPVLSVNPNKEEARKGTCGKVLPCFEVEIRGGEGQIVAPGTEGNLWVRGPSVAGSYFRMPQLTAERFIDGWFDTRDIVSLDEDGYLTVVSRVSDIVIVGGYNVYPGEVESVLMEHPDVLESAVVGVSRGASGEVIKAFVVLKEGRILNPRDLITFCRTRLAYYKIPRVVAFVKGLPRSSVGEVIKRELKNR